MNLDERLCDLCQQGMRTQAESLAKAALTNEPVEAVEIDDPHVHVDTPHFRGVHQLKTDRQGDLDVRSRGEYTYMSDAVELSFSTATMHERAHARAQDTLAAQSEPDSQAADDDHPHPEDSASPTPDAVATAPDRQTTSPVGFLKGLL